jgi:GNAT superfamily N-acetyltransferase
MDNLVPRNLTIDLHVVLALYFTLELTGSHNRQKDFELGVWNHGEPMGYLNYSIFEGEVSVHYVFVRPDQRRRGIASALYKRLQEEYPGQPIRRFGDVSTDDGYALTHALNLPERQSQEVPCISN